MTPEEEKAIAEHYKNLSYLMQSLSDDAVKEYAINATYTKEEMLAYREGVYTIINFYKQTLFRLENQIKGESQSDE
jgi:hypothetical protein